MQYKHNCMFISEDTNSIKQLYSALSTNEFVAGMRLYSNSSEARASIVLCWSFVDIVGDEALSELQQVLPRVSRGDIILFKLAALRNIYTYHNDPCIHPAVNLVRDSAIIDINLFEQTPSKALQEMIAGLFDKPVNSITFDNIQQQ